MESTPKSAMEARAEGKVVKTAIKIMMKEGAAKPETATDDDRGVIRIGVVVIGIGRRVNHLRRRDVDWLSDGRWIIGRRRSLLLRLCSRRLDYLDLWSVLKHGGDDASRNPMLMQVDNIVGL